VKPSASVTFVRIIGVTLLVAWSLGPIVMGVMTSMSTQPETQQVPARWVPQHPTLDNYEALLGGGKKVSSDDAAADSSQFGRAMINTTVLTLVTTAIVLAISVCAGYGFSRTEFKGSKQLLWIVLATMVIPIFTIVVALYKLMAELNLVNTFLGLVLVYASSTAPLAIWLFYNYVRDLPPEPEEAALIDGCNRFGAFRRVVLPQMRSGIAALTAIVMLFVWGQFLIPLLLTSTEETKPVTVIITEFIGKYTTNYPLLTAAGILAVVPPAIVALVLNRHIRGMLSAGG
jgi:multiple sugar transport system permease protein